MSFGKVSGSGRRLVPNVRCQIGRKPMPATKDQWKAFREELSQQLEDERRFIANAEAGKTGIWSVQPGKGKVDTTAAHVEISRRAVQALEG